MWHLDHDDSILSNGVAPSFAPRLNIATPAHQYHAVAFTGFHVEQRRNACIMLHCGSTSQRQSRLDALSLKRILCAYYAPRP